MKNNSLVFGIVTAGATGQTISPSVDALPVDIGQAERGQDEILTAMNMVPGAWKVGASTQEVRDNTGLTSVFLGAVSQDRTRQSPAHISDRDLRHLGVECEVAFCLSQDLLPREGGYDLDEVKATIASVHPSFELPETRLGELGEHGPFALIMDNGAAGWCVIGAAVVDSVGVDLKGLSVCLSVDGKEVASGSSDSVINGPYDALVEAIKLASARGYSLYKGQYILVGSCTGITYVSPGVNVVGDFGPLGTVELTIDCVNE